jgi:hypothetical protein
MPSERPATESVTATVSNVSGGNIAIGHTVTQTSTVTSGAAPVSPQELAELKQEFADLRQQLLHDPEVPDEAAAKLDQLQEAVTAPEPDIGTMERVRNWFLMHAPKVAGAVMALVVNPIVGSLVAAAGDAVSSEFRKRFIDE